MYSFTPSDKWNQLIYFTVTDHVINDIILPLKKSHSLSA